MSNLNLNKGKIGEQKASLYLQKKGYHLIEKNFRKRYGEIDIIAIDTSTCELANSRQSQPTLVFVEVKTRFSHEYGCPEEAVTSWKIKTLIRSAQYYKLLHRELPDLMRIDVVSVEIDSEGEVKSIRHIKNITQ